MIIGLYLWTWTYLNFEIVFCAVFEPDSIESANCYSRRYVISNGYKNVVTLVLAGNITVCPKKISGLGCTMLVRMVNMCTFCIPLG